MYNQWIIDKDIIEHGETDGTKCAGYDEAMKMPVKFKMYDDDGNLYFEGRMQEHDFHPLDEFGMPSYGCTYIETKRDDGTWEVL